MKLQAAARATFAFLLLWAASLAAPVTGQSLLETVSDARQDPAKFAQTHEECIDGRTEYYLGTALGGAPDTGLACTGPAILRQQAETSVQMPQVPLRSQASENQVEWSHPVGGGPLPDLTAVDWDGDGVPNAFDEVNLPSEALSWTTAADSIVLVDGLGERDIVLLVEPEHKEAYFVGTTDTSSPLSGFTSGVPTVDDTLQAVQEAFGNGLSQAFANVLNPGMVVHTVTVAADSPATIPLTWGSSRPADGSWLLVRSDPTRLITLTLAGANVPLAPGLPSHLTGDSSEHFRWELLPLHGQPSFCFDALTATGLGPCTGDPGSGWLRTFSGQAAYALRVSVNQLQDASPALRRPEAGNVTDAPADSPFGSQAASSQSSGLSWSTTTSSFDPFNTESPVRLFGNLSQDLPPGLGIDYLADLAPNALLAPFAAVEGQLPEQAVARTDRTFHFDGVLNRIPAEPRNLNHLRLLIEDADGNAAGQWFLADGRLLRELLEMPMSERLEAAVDSEHRTGFLQVEAERTGDGVPDLLVFIPHFSQASLVIRSANPEANTAWWDIELTSATTGWLSGTRGAVYRYRGPDQSLLRRDIPGITTSQRTLGMHLVSDTEFYVVGDSGSGQLPFVAHYDNGSWTSVESLATSGVVFYDVWISPDGVRGVIAGSGGTWFRKDASNPWGHAPPAQRPPSFPCSFIEIEFDANGQGYVGTGYEPGTCAGSGTVSAVMHFDGTTWTQKSGSDVTSVYDVLSPSGEHAAGIPDASTEAGVYRQAISGSFVQDAPNPSANHAYFGVAQPPGSSDIWFAGAGACAGCGTLLQKEGSTWRKYDNAGLNQMQAIEFANVGHGLAGGVGQLVLVDFPPAEVGSVVPSHGTTSTQFRGDGTGSIDSADGTNLVHEWFWDDGTSSTGVVATHFYSLTGTYDVVHRVTDTSGLTAQRTYRISVGAEEYTSGTTCGTGRAGSFEDANGPAAHHYYLNAPTTDRIARIALCQQTNLFVQGRLGQEVLNVGTWPATGARGWQLQGLVPAGQRLYFTVEQPTGNAPQNYEVTARFLAPPAIRAGTLDYTDPADRRYPVFVEAIVDHPETLTARLEVDWGDASTTLTNLGAPGAAHATSHLYATAGAKTVRITPVDELGGRGTTTTVTVNVWNPPAATVDAVTTFSQTTAVASGDVTSLGGASSVSARYVLHTTPETFSPTFTVTGSAPVAVPDHTFTSLQAGTTYTYSLEVWHAAATARSTPRQFSTGPSLALTPVLSATSFNTNLGTAISFDVHAATAHPQGRAVHYEVRFGDGAQRNFPTSTPLNVPASQNVPVSYTHPFAGTYTGEVRIVDDQGARSAPVSFAATVTGGSPVSRVFHTGFATSARLFAEMSQIPAGSNLQLRFTYFDVVNRVQVDSPAISGATSGTTLDWLTGTLDTGRWYPVQVRLTSSLGATWQGPAAPHQFAVNQPPTLTFDADDINVDYRDYIHIEATYTDIDGDAPRAADGSHGLDLLAGSLRVKMTSAAGTARTGERLIGDYRLAPGTAEQVRFELRDAFGHLTTIPGPWGYFSGTHAFYQDAETDTPGAVPSGFTPESFPGRVNHWNVADTGNGQFPDEAAMGLRGQAIWFGNPVSMTYADPAGGNPGGRIRSGPIDLTGISRPALSFATYFQTEDDGTHDVKRVLAQTRRSDGTWPSTWDVLVPNLRGPEQGFRQWVTIGIPMDAYAGKHMRIAFEFDAGNANGNNHLGWLVDDVVIGVDSDGEGSSDTSERNTIGPVMRRHNPTPITVGPGEQKSTVVRNFYHPFGERVFATATIRSPDTSGLEFWLSAAPLGYVDTDRNDLLNNHGILHLPAGFATDATASYPACGSSLVEQNPIGSPWSDLARNPTRPELANGNLPPHSATAYGSPATTHVAFTPTTDGVRLQVELTNCLGTDAGGSSPLDYGHPQEIYVVVENHGSDDATIEAFSVVAAGRTSAFQADTDGDGNQDSVDARIGSTPAAGTGLASDIDGDGWTDGDVNPWIPNKIPTVVLDTDQFPGKIRLMIQSDIEVADPVFSNVGGRVDNIVRGSNDHWRHWDYEFENIWDIQEVRFQIQDVYGGTTDVRFAEQGTNVWVYSLVYRWRNYVETEEVCYPASTLHRIHRMIARVAVDYMTGKVLDVIVDGKSEPWWTIGTLADAQNARYEPLKAVGFDLTDPTNYQFQNPTCASSNASVFIQKPWVHGDSTVQRSGVHVPADFSTFQGVTSFSQLNWLVNNMDGGVTSGLNQHRWFVQPPLITGGDLYILEGDSNGRIQRGFKVTYPTSNGFQGNSDAVAALLATEAEFHDNYRTTTAAAAGLCHHRCLASQSGAPVFHYPGPATDMPGHLMDGEWMDAMGKNGYAYYANGGNPVRLGDTPLSEAAWAYNTVWFLRNYIRTPPVSGTPSAVTSVTGYTSFWNPASFLSQCVSTSRICAEIEPGSSQNFGPSANRMQIAWLQGNVQVSIDHLAVRGAYNPVNYFAYPTARSPVVQTEDELKTGLSGTNPFGNDRVLITVDATGTNYIDIRELMDQYERNRINAQFLQFWRPGVFKVTYET